MNLKELHNPTLRQEDNRLYLVGNIEKQPDSENYYDNSGWCDNERYKSDHKKWEKSKVKYPVRESDSEEIILFLSNIFRSDHEYAPYSYSDFTKSLPKGIPVPPELMERLVLNKSTVSLCEESCDNSWCKTRGCMNPVNGDDVRLEVTLKEEPKGESEDEYFVIVTTQGNFDIEDDINIPSGRYKLVKVK